MQCVPPFRLKRGSYNNKRSRNSISEPHNGAVGGGAGGYESDGQFGMENMSLVVGSTNATSLLKQKQQQQLNSSLHVQLDKPAGLMEQESLIDYDSSDEDDGSQSSAEDPSHKDQQTAVVVGNGLANIPVTVSPISSMNSFQDAKHSTIWIGNEDGSLHIFQFSDSAVRTVARKNRITKQFPAGIKSILYLDNKVYISIKNGDMVVFKRNFCKSG